MNYRAYRANSRRKGAGRFSDSGHVSFKGRTIREYPSDFFHHSPINGYLVLSAVKGDSRDPEVRKGSMLSFRLSAYCRV